MLGVLCQPAQAQSASSEKLAPKASDVYLQLSTAEPDTDADTGPARMHGRQSALTNI